MLIIGAGPSGLAAAHVLCTEFSVSLAESRDAIGGTWILTEAGDSGTAMYPGLRTNIPNELMAFRNERFPDGTAAFPGQAEVLAYLEGMARKWGILDNIELRTEVVGAEWDAEKRVWNVDLTRLGEEGVETRRTEPFEFLLACNGHYSVPQIPSIPGLDSFRGISMHSKFFRTPDTFANLRVMVVGGASSGLDISRILTASASHVYLSAQTLLGNLAKGVELVASIARVVPEGVELNDGTVLQLDAILWATGYKYSFPFLDSETTGPLSAIGLPKLELFALAAENPALAFLGLPTKVIPFPLAETQAEFVKSVWTGRLRPPGPVEQQTWEDLRSAYLAQTGQPSVVKDPTDELRRKLDLAGDLQWIYQDYLASLVGVEKTEEFRWEMRRRTGQWRLEELGY